MVMGQESVLKWYAVRVRSHREDLVAKHMRARGLESFLPLYRCQHRWSDRFKEIDVPLFTGYVFCQFDVRDRLPVLTVPGVVHVVGVGKTPLPIEDAEIQAIQTAIQSGRRAQPSPFLTVGNKVRIEYGPLCGIEGILEGFKGRQRLVLSITLLQRSVEVELNGDVVRPVSLQPRCSDKPVASRRYLAPSWSSPA